MCSVDAVTYKVAKAYLKDGWHTDVSITIENGVITQVQKVSDEVEGGLELNGLLLPGIPNLHSHAFQRALAGLTEHTVGHTDTFWTWREAMYKLAMNFNPILLKAVATQLYSEMLQAGYTSVVEFHYVHQPDPLRMSQAIIDAALETGIRLTLLPVLYQQSDFHNQPPNAGQQHFYHSLNDYLELVARLDELTKDHSQIEIGVAPHSIRAVGFEAMSELFKAYPNKVKHIHAAEQQKEINDSLNAYNARPVEWLLDNFDVDESWCLIHCTHMTDEEVVALAKSKAVVGLCPTTEGNLGDGFFKLREYLAAGGRFGIGTDSNSSVNLVEELRLMEYVQRLRFQERNIVAGAQGSTGENLYNLSVAGGAQALGKQVGSIEVGQAADFILLDSEHPQLIAHTDTLFDAFIFSGNQNPIKKVMVNGEWVKPSENYSKDYADAIKVIIEL